MKLWGRSSRALLNLLLLACPAADAAERFDHRGALGLLVEGGLELGELVQGGRFDEYSRPGADLGFTVAIGENGNELKAMVRAARSDSVAWSIFAGYRGYFGPDRFKTFFDLDLGLDLRPELNLGPRFGFGFQYEIHSLFGVFAGLAARVGIGDRLRFAAEGFVGLQVRSYLLE